MPPMRATQQQQKQIDKRTHAQIIMKEPLEPDAPELLSKEEVESNEPDDNDLNEADDKPESPKLDAEESHGPSVVVTMAYGERV